MYLKYLRDLPVQDAGCLKEYLEGLDGGLGGNCYLLNCGKLALLFSIVVCTLGAKIDREVRDELLVRMLDCVDHSPAFFLHMDPYIWILSPMFARCHSLLAMGSYIPWLPHLDHHASYSLDAVYHSPLHPLRAESVV